MWVETATTRRGHLAESALPFSFDAIGLVLTPGYYFADSFGGRLHGAKASVHEQWTGSFYTEVGVDFVKYTKITNDNDIAFSTVAWTGYELLKGWTVSGGVEYNKNNAHNKDIRASFRMDYRFDHGI